jgi:hypothetical protein
MLTLPEPASERRKEKEREEDELDMMDMSRVKCYNCEGFGHIARDCTKPKKSRVSRQGNGKRGKFSQTLFALDEDPEPQSYYYNGEFIRRRPPVA